MMGMGLGCYNLVGNSPLTSLSLTVGKRFHSNIEIVVISLIDINFMSTNNIYYKVFV
jgi:hypothetical protein